MATLICILLSEAHSGAKTYSCCPDCVAKLPEFQQCSSEPDGNFPFRDFKAWLTEEVPSGERDYLFTRQAMK